MLVSAGWDNNFGISNPPLPTHELALDHFQVQTLFDVTKRRGPNYRDQELLKRSSSRNSIKSTVSDRNLP